MTFEKLKEDIEQIQIYLKAILDTNIAYYKLWLFKVFMKSITSIAKIFFILTLLLFFILFFSIAMAIFLSTILKSYTLGFLIVGLFYLLLCSIIAFVKTKSVEKYLLKTFSEFFFND